MTIRDLPEGKIAVVVQVGDSWLGRCVYKKNAALYFVGMEKDIRIYSDRFYNLKLRIVGDFSV